MTKRNVYDYTDEDGESWFGWGILVVDSRPRRPWKAAHARKYGR